MLISEYPHWKLLTRKQVHWLIDSFLLLVLPLIVSSCARMGQPDGGWYDETPPRVVGASPADGSTNVNTKKINIFFSEFIKLDNDQSKIVVSPPQLEVPEIKGEGKSIRVTLADSLKKNTTYTIDFSDAISDNNEDNPLGNYTYSFSTGDHIDTLQVAGYVIDAENLEPIKGILVGLYSNLADSAFVKLPMLRVSRTDSRGRFVVKGVAPGSYHVFALQDADGDYKFSQKSEKIAFSHDVIVPSFKPDIRQDTIWTDSLHIKNIVNENYTHFLPDNICLSAFSEEMTDRYLVKNQRQEADHFTLFFSYGNPKLPEIKGLNFNEKNAFIVEPTEKKDTITYWLRDSALVNQDTLRMAVKYLATDSLGKLIDKADTLTILSKDPYEKRLKREQKTLSSWQKQQKKLKDKGERYDSIMPKRAMDMQINIPFNMAPDQNIAVTFPKPLAKLDTSAVHLYAKHDTLWYRAPFEFKKIRSRDYQLLAEWRPGIEYSLEIDSTAFTDIYGTVSGKYKQGFKIPAEDQFSSLFVTVNGMSDSTAVVQLLDQSDKVIKEIKTKNGTAEFYYINPGTYYMRMYVDRNNNGLWDTGDYDHDRQPEPVYYYPESIECRAKWDVSRDWNPMSRPLYQQKPSAITKQKPDSERKIKHRNAERAHKLGIPYDPTKE
ncbi:Ig-like domain-containing protein [Prevotella cerevisiae]|uniref:Ig-like domain-containing protein n=1 Tax=Segatella cerevisiae TaxID=2053716 RepID=A0ABT1BZH2_9BACT|nr:Ig-like domain-containing protein [Segatella cerevisiae]MCO6025623.1 Ig-like domain-containing protein [Segatella cerevisiae]